MTDRELLGLAAKAYGVRLNQYREEDFLRADHSPLGQFWNPRWNPLESDGDALRLAVKLSIRIEPSPRGCSVMWPVPEGMRVETVLCNVIGADPNAATRRAIVRAAAEIGEAMP